MTAPINEVLTPRRSARTHTVAKRALQNPAVVGATTVVMPPHEESEVIASHIVSQTLSQRQPYRSKPSVVLDETTTNTIEAIGAKAVAKEYEEPPRTVVSRATYKLSLYHQAPDYLRLDNILTGYRVGFSPKMIFWSIFRLHNQTVNIYTHMLPGVAMLALLVGLWMYYITEYRDKVAFTAYLVGSAICLFCSTVFHWFNCTSRVWYYRLIKCDVNGIVAMVAGTTISVLMYGFQCFPWWQKFHAVWYTTLTITCIVCSQIPWFLHPDRKLVRTFLYGAMVLGALVATAHSGFLYGWDHPDTQYFHRSFIWAGLNIIVGSVVYVKKIPESWFPGRFDIWGSSHQLWHLFVAGTAAMHVRGLLGFYFYASNECPNGVV